MSGRWQAALAVAAVLAVIVAALVLVGSPRTARLERLDDRRVADLEALVRRIETYRTLERDLPADLGALDARLPQGAPVRDPVTAASYQYQALGGGHFRVCAELALPGRYVAEQFPRRRAFGGGHAIEPVIDPSGGRLCLQTATAPVGSD